MFRVARHNSLIINDGEKFLHIKDYTLPQITPFSKSFSSRLIKSIFCENHLWNFTRDGIFKIDLSNPYKKPIRYDYVSTPPNGDITDRERVKDLGGGWIYDGGSPNIVAYLGGTGFNYQEGRFIGYADNGKLTTVRNDSLFLIRWNHNKVKIEEEFRASVPTPHQINESNIAICADGSIVYVKYERSRNVFSKNNKNRLPSYSDNSYDDKLYLCIKDTLNSEKVLSTLNGYVDAFNWNEKARQIVISTRERENFKPVSSQHKVRKGQRHVYLGTFTDDFKSRINIKKHSFNLLDDVSAQKMFQTKDPHKMLLLVNDGLLEFNTQIAQMRSVFSAADHGYEAALFEGLVWNEDSTVFSIYGIRAPTVELSFPEYSLKQIFKASPWIQTSGGFLPNGEAFTATSDAVSFWDKNRDMVFRVEMNADGGLFVENANSYYFCDKNAVRNLIYYNQKLDIVGFDQLDPLFNRPDKVLKTIGSYFNTDLTHFIKEAELLYAKRIAQSGSSTLRFLDQNVDFPDCDVLNRDSIERDWYEASVPVHIRSDNSISGIRNLNIYINEVPMYGYQGVLINSSDSFLLDTVINVSLSTGLNKISVEIKNHEGLSNFKYPVYVNYISKEPTKAQLYYIGIGVNKFMDSKHNLSYCVNDVKDLAQFLVRDTNRSIILTDTAVTRENNLALKRYLDTNTTVNDKVIISCSSHGLLDDSLNFYLATYDMDFANPAKRGVSYEALEGLLDSIPARQKLLLLDACNSGENDKTELRRIELNRKVEIGAVSPIVARGILVEMAHENRNKFQKLNELFVNVRNNTGSFIISAAGGQQSAYEGSAVKVDGKPIDNGAFTYSVLEYLRINRARGEQVTVNDLKQYVEGRVEEITGGSQKPTSRQETMDTDWVIGFD